MRSSTVNNVDNQPVVQIEVNLTRRVVNRDSNGTVNIALQIENINHRTITPSSPLVTYRDRETMGLVRGNGTVNIVLQIGNINHLTITPSPPVTHPERETAGFRLVRGNPTPGAAERFQMEKLEEKEEQQGLKSCAVCLDEIDCKKCDCVRIVCGHVYHKSCILAWLNNSNSCPVCRTPLPLTR